VWPLTIAQTKKYLNGSKIYIFVNKLSAEFPASWVQIVYDDTLRYQERFSSCLMQVEEEVVLFNHEDMVLYDAPDYTELERLSGIVENGGIDILKLFRGEASNNMATNRIYHNIYENVNGLYFAIQPSLCKKSKLLKVYQCTPGDTLWEFETNAGTVTRYQKIKSCMYYKGNEPKRGLYHWDSEIYPYVATSVVKGKWNMSEYGSILGPLLEENGIDLSIRGAC
jgi:hypothetical protein